MPTPEPFRFGAIVLAAGASTRLGQPKQLLPVAGGRPLLAHTVDALLASPAWPVIVVLGADAARLRPVMAKLPVQIVLNPTWAEGMASSLRIGLQILRHFPGAPAAALFTVCDLPGFSTAAVEALAQAMETSGRGIAAVKHGEAIGVPAIFRQRYFEELAALSGDQGARGLLKKHRGDVAAIERPELVFDLDTPADYEAWQARDYRP